MAILAVAALIRLPTLGAQSLWYDEAATWEQVSGTLGEVISRTAADNYPPLFNLLAWVSVQLLGDAEWALRLPSALLGVGTVALTYAVGSRVGGRATGLIAALLLALSGYHVWYSQEARMYTLLAATTTAHGWAVLALLDRARPGAAALVALSGVLLVYSHPYGALNWIAIGLGAVWVICTRRQWTALLGLALAGVIVALCFLPWALILVERARVIADTGFWIAEPSPHTVFLQWRKLTGALFLPLLAALPFLYWFRRKLQSRLAPGALPVLLAWTLLPGVIGIVVSLLVEPVLFDRYLIGSLPAFLILFAVAVLAPVRTRRGTAIAGLACLGIGVLTLLFGGGNPRDDWRGMVAAARPLMRPGDCIALLDPSHDVAVDYYLRDPSRCLLDGTDASAVRAVPESSGILLLSAQMGPARRDAVIEAISATRPLIAHHGFAPGDVHVFAAPEDGP